MTVLRSVRVAAIQATPEILDAEGSVAKAVRLLGEAADAGAELAVLPECFVSLYPSNAWAKGSAAFGGSDELWERMWLSSVDVPGPLVDELVAVCRARGIHAVIGVNERESDRPGTLYNAMLTLGPEGLLHKHRKLMPTQHERLFHGIGAGDDLRVVDTPAGRVGGLICWENRMPLARYALYRQGPQIWVAPTADDSDGWIAHMRAIAIESGAFVVSRPAVHPALRVPGGLPARAARPARSTGAAAPWWSSRRAATSWPARCTARRACSCTTATCATGCTPSAGSTSSGTTAGRTCWWGAAARRRRSRRSRPSRSRRRSGLAPPANGGWVGEIGEGRRRCAVNVVRRSCGRGPPDVDRL